MGRDGRHRVLTTVVCVALAAANGWGGALAARTWANGRAVDEACGGLVPAKKVAALPHSGGRITHNKEAIDARTVSGNCVLLSSAEEGPRYDGSFFEADVWLETRSVTVDAKDPLSGDQVVDEDGWSGDMAAPVGGGIAGVVTDSGVTVKLPCAGVRRGGREVANVVARAGSPRIPADPDTPGDQLDQRSRDTLASVAVDMANRAGHGLRCPRRLPAPPAHLPPLRGSLIRAGDATGTCGWYGHLSRRDDRLPDQAMETRTDGDVWSEECGLVLNQHAAVAAWEKYHRTSGRMALRGTHRPREKGEWWAATQSFFGTEAGHVMISGIDRTWARPGHAGAGNASWWSSSVCRGRPAVHTFTIAYPYDRPAAASFAPVFRAYVADVARRRGCTDIRFPEAADFHPHG